MRQVDYGDVFGGLLLTGIGAFAAIEASITLQLGTFDRMGPGMFPFILGIVLVLTGLPMTIGGLMRSGSLPHVDWRPLIFCGLAILVFALVIRGLGVVPAVVLMAVTATFAKPGWSLVKSLALALALAGLAVLVFNQGLGNVIEPFRWPF